MLQNPFLLAGCGISLKPIPSLKKLRQQELQANLGYIYISLSSREGCLTQKTTTKSNSPFLSTVRLKQKKKNLTITEQEIKIYNSPLVWEKPGDTG